MAILLAEGNNMKTTIKTKGMMCTGCQKRVTTALNQVEGIHDVDASYKTGDVNLRYDSEEALKNAKQAIEDTGYEVV